MIIYPLSSLGYTFRMPTPTWGTDTKPPITFSVTERTTCILPLNQAFSKLEFFHSSCHPVHKSKNTKNLISLQFVYHE